MGEAVVDCCVSLTLLLMIFLIVRFALFHASFLIFACLALRFTRMLGLRLIADST